MVKQSNKASHLFVRPDIHIAYMPTQWLKWSCEAGVVAHLTKPGWSNPIPIPQPTNLAFLGIK